ncbi:MAG: low-specificity L-threonine aldolase [Desulfobacterales bacterium CG07_land_8_20_14_0_80_52_14]|nr:MAG: low-specificity L-threonine aldolase [Desulfobacterales bacterium CG23_combo_of_CG06-09_8_20_14_all_52_9]PIU49731.1 MAG: low-specificity L-threonine aldolase [Desulfobacterales bacterium CG07_land_8_20_14_0_80_52_14]
MQLIDLRSDTVTLPTPSMRQAMFSAEVGDDVFGEDPTIKRLEEMAARRMGKEAALFVASGTMANIISQMIHCGRGDEMILGDQAHIFWYEQGGSAALGGIHPRTVKNQWDGTLAPEDIEAAIRPDNVHFPRTRLIVLENTHNRCDGSPIGPDYMEAVADLARRFDLKIHVDGARIFNAAIALGVDPTDLTRYADSVSFCLSKGLGAPAGSLICGSNAFITQARRVRKVLGGGMRQAGVLAAAGIVALTEMVDRLADDHDNAHALAVGLSRINGISIDYERIKTNIVYFGIIQKDLSPPQLCEKLNAAGVRVLPADSRRLRAVTHYPITKLDIEAALEAVAAVMG